MKKTKDEILESVKAYHDAPTEETYISLLEDITDSFEDVSEELTATIENLTQQLAELNQKYIDRFFSAGEEDPTEDKEDNEEENEKVEIDDLFEEVE